MLVIIVLIVDIKMVVPTKKVLFGMIIFCIFFGNREISGLPIMVVKIGNRDNLIKMRVKHILIFLDAIVYKLVLIWLWFIIPIFM